MNFRITAALWLALATILTAQVAQRPMAAANDVPKEELHYEVKEENGRLMMTLKNDSQSALAIKIGQTRALLRAGENKKLAFPNQQAPLFEVYRRKPNGNVVPMFTGVLPQRPSKGALEVRP